MLSLEYRSGIRYLWIVLYVLLLKYYFFLVSVQTKQRGPNINLIFYTAVQT